MRLVAATIMAAACLTSCIDEDLTDCGKDYKLNYNVRLRTNIATEIDAELTSDVERQFGLELKDALKDVFTDWARDLDLSFYTDDAQLALHNQQRMDAAQASYTIYLPVKRYENLALANTEQETNVSVEGGDNERTLCLRQTEADTLASHAIGLFSARQTMELADRDQEFDVDLYMQNCTACLVLDPGTANVADIRGCVTSLASSFGVADSTYAFDRSVPVRAQLLRSAKTNLIGLYSTGFPSRDRLAPTATTTATTPHDNAATRDADEKSALWQMKVYVRLTNGKTTESILSIADPLRAGQLRIIKAAIRDDGGIITHTHNVGVDIELDWKPGGDHNIDI